MSDTIENVQQTELDTLKNEVDEETWKRFEEIAAIEFRKGRNQAGDSKFGGEEEESEEIDNTIPGWENAERAIELLTEKMKQDYTRNSEN